MPDQKISDDASLAAASVAAGDLFPIVDISEAAAADRNKKMTAATLLQGVLLVSTGNLKEASNQIIVPNGSASAPGICHAGAATSGMYFPGANTIGLAAAGTPTVVLNGGNGQARFFQYGVTTSLLGTDAGTGNSNRAANDVVIATGSSTGNGANSTISFQTCPSGSSGTSVNPYVTAARITESGIEFPQVSDVAAPSTNCAGIGAEDVAGTAELIAVDEAGNETQVTPHAADGPPSLYDSVPGQEKVIRTVNRYRGEVSFINLTRLAKEVERLGGKKILHLETLSAYNSRSGRNKTPLNWDDVQKRNQEAWDRKRSVELEALRLYQLAVQERESQTESLSLWEKLPAELKAKTPQPVVAPVIGPPPEVRPAKSVAKPKPKSL